MNLPEGEWIKICNFGECPEFLRQGDMVFFRNSRKRDEIIGFTLAEWRQHIADAKAGKYDEPDCG